MRQLFSATGPEAAGPQGLRREAVSTLWNVPSLHSSPKWAAEFSSSYVTLSDGSQKRCERNQLSAVKPDI